MNTGPFPVRIASIVPKGYPGYDGEPHDPAYWDRVPAFVQARIDHMRQYFAYWTWKYTGVSKTLLVEYKHLIADQDIYWFCKDYNTGTVIQGEPWRERKYTIDPVTKKFQWAGGIPEAKPAQTLDGCQRAPIPEGQGVHATRVWDYLRDKLGWSLDVYHAGDRWSADPEIRNPIPARQLAFVVGAGGYDGGRSSPNTLDPGYDVGFAVCGDWWLVLLMTGHNDRAAEARYHNPVGFNSATGEPLRDAKGDIIYEVGGVAHDPEGGSGVVIHELGHGLYMNTHDPTPIYKLADDPGLENIQNFLKYNAKFLVDATPPAVWPPQQAPAPMPEPTPVPPPPPPPTPPPLPPTPALMSVTVSGPAALKVGAIAQYTATAVYSDGSTKAITSGFMSSNPASLTVLGAGKGVANAVGTAEVVCGSGRLTVTVSKPRGYWWRWW